jgi:hypothetical protein
MAERERKASIVEAEDEHRLAELGYKQELNRNWSLLNNFGVSFSIIVCVSFVAEEILVNMKARAWSLASLHSSGIFRCAFEPGMA